MNFNLPLFLLTHRILTKKPVGSLPPSEEKTGEYILRYKCPKCDCRDDRNVFYYTCCPSCGYKVSDREFLNRATEEIGRWVETEEKVPTFLGFGYKIKINKEWIPKNVD